MNEQEFVSYMHLLLETADLFNYSGLKITIALHPQQILPKIIYDRIDRVHLMTYDMIQQNDHHASYENSKCFSSRSTVLLTNRGQLFRD